MIKSAKFDEAYRRFEEVGIVPVVVLQDAEDAVPLAKCLVEGGLPAAEVTFRTDAAEESIRRMAKAYPDMLVGAGTVLTIDQVNRAVDAGAKFIVSCGFDPKVVEYCIDRDIPVCPGTSTPSEMMAAMQLGLDHVKFFPAELNGGLPKIKAITAALVNLKIMPTGGINAGNVRDYLSNEKIFCAGGSWMVKGDFIKAHDWDTITKKVEEAAAIVREVRK